MSMSHDVAVVLEQERGRDSLKLGCVAGLAALSDVLFWRQQIGVSAALMVAALMAAILAVNGSRLREGHRIGGMVIGALTLAPLIETISPLSLVFGWGGIAAFALIATGQLNARWPHAVVPPIKLLLLGPFRVLPDIEAILVRQGGIMGRIGGLVRWIVPVTFSCVFLALFAAANPMIEGWLARIDLRTLWDIVVDGRAMFWIAAAFAIWGLVCVRAVKLLQRERTQSVPLPASATPSRMASQIFGHGAIVRSLLLFNGLFALQTVLDLAFLWHGAALPAGMSYASYAHRGAYPLMVTAALAAVFVVRAFGPGSTLENSKLARGLVFAWIAQNVLLVLSSILRLMLYVDVYALSYWRVAAFIWMGLVAVGLALILLRIACKGSNVWLVGANIAVVLSVMYVCCFIDFAGAIATYNIAHSREVSGRGLNLDRAYIVALGPQAIPAMDQEIARLSGTSGASLNDWIVLRRNCLAHDVTASQVNWRTWTWRGARLASTLAKQPAPGPCRL